VPPLDVVARLVAAVGTKQNLGYYHGAYYGFETCLSDVDLKAARPDAGRHGVGEAWARFGAYGRTKASRTVVRDLWASVLAVFGDRLRYGSHVDTTAQWYEATRLAELVGIDHAAILEAAIAELPEPKSWAKLKADGKPKAKGKGKAKRSKSAAAARAAVPA
jgi:hypothetical protein